MIINPFSMFSRACGNSEKCIRLESENFSLSDLVQHCLSVKHEGGQLSFYASTIDIVCWIYK